jgi:polysaccharide export outer membrane protein
MKRTSVSFPQLFSILIFLSVFGWQTAATAQNSPPQTSTQPGVTATEPSIVTAPHADNSQQNTASPAPSTKLLIGPGDEIEVTVYGAPDLSGHMRVNANGNISLPLVGPIRMAGLSSSEAEAAIEAQLRDKSVVNDPQVSVYVKEYGSSGISVAGEVAKPGFYSVLGPHRLFDVLQAAGGPTEKASNKVTISHRGETETNTIVLSKDPAQMAVNNIELQPGDTVVVPRAGIVYVLGEVGRPGGYVLNASGGVTVLQVVAVAGGTTHVASAGKSRLLRKTDNGFQEQHIDLKKLLRGQIHDIPVHDEDILFVPSSVIKEALSASTLVGFAATAAIYRVPY